MTDAEWLERFEACTLPEGPFHHADHVKMAFLFFRKYAPADAIGRFVAALRRFAIAMHVPNLYHETITWALLLLIRDRMARAPESQLWEEFAAANPDLLSWKDILSRYYRPETLQSELAKRAFLFPDKI